MTKETAELITDYSGEIHEDYSGRGMYGETTTAVVLDSENDFYKAIAGIFNDCMLDSNMHDADLIIQYLKNVKMDNLGTGIIIY